MEIWWIVLALFVLAAIVVLAVVWRNARQGSSENAPTSAPDRDFAADREASRLSGMSAEDRDWQAASLEKDRANRERTPPDQQ